MHLINRDDFANILLHEIRFRAANPAEDEHYDDGLEVALDYLYNAPGVDLSSQTEMMLDAIGIPATLEQTAEECAELAHACLKLARIIRKENPTPVPREKAEDHLCEELADVQICIDELSSLYDFYDRMSEKKLRLQERMNAVRG